MGGRALSLPDRGTSPADGGSEWVRTGISGPPASRTAEYARDRIEEEVGMTRSRMFPGNWLVVLLVAAALALVPPALCAGSDDSIYERVELYQSVIDKVASRYVTEVDPGDLIIRSIEGMIGSLDPYSQLLDPDDYSDLKVDTKGRFGGIGIEIGLRNDILTVIAPIEGTPAHRLGLQSGDRIISIEGESTKGWNTLDAVKKLRGPKGTEVTITIDREGLDEPFDVTIERDIIKVKSVPYYFMIDSSTGFLRLSAFSENSGKEVRDAIRELQEEGMESLILDLRYNPGGLLTQAVEVAEIFMDKGEMIVYTDGRFEGQDREYHSKRDGLTRKMPVVVLINRYSASASEIVAGALQDHDRALILGEPSFGKGSVQTLFDLGNDYALRLTTAYYFTPSGRSIHRVDKSEDAAVAEHHLVPRNGDEPAEQGGFYTDSGREVTGGGGIHPDIVVEPEPISEIVQRMVVKPVFFNYAVKFHSEHPEIDETFTVTDTLLDDYFAFMVEQGIEVTREEFDSEIDFVRSRLGYEIDRAYWGEAVAKKRGIGQDVEVQRALELIGEGKTLAGLLEVAMRTQGDVRD
jgi:carboxyl-terminal processing protease